MDIYTPEEWGKVKKMFINRNNKRPVIRLDVQKVRNNGGGYYTIDQYSQIDKGNLVLGQKVQFSHDGQVVAEIIENDYQVLVVREVKS